LFLTYVGIAAAALLFDVLGDRSFGALMLSSLPVAFVAVVCLLVGPWLNGERKTLALRAWFVGAALVLAIALAFSSLGSEQAKTGELIFTYAALLMSLPFSLLMPVVMNCAEPLVRDSIVLRLTATWVVCVLAGGIGWSVLCWVSSRAHRRKGVPKMKNLLAKLLGRGSHLSELDGLVLGCVRERLDSSIAELWDRQVQAINKVQRLPEGVEVNFYRMKGGRPSFDETLSFPNKTTELLIAEVRAELPDMGELTAKVWCVKGFLFSIEYEGSVSYFEEAAGMDPAPTFNLSCELTADLASA
jgi:hypothetical protein